MNEKALVTLILGNDFDGEVISSPEDCDLHMIAIRKLYRKLLNNNKNIGEINLNDDCEACYDLMNLGHILIKSVRNSSYLLYFIYVPNNMSVKQLNALKQLLPYFVDKEIYYFTLNGECMNMEKTNNIEKKLIK